MSEFDLTLNRDRLSEVRHGAVLVTTEPAVFRVQGPGALTCLQGLLTNDLVKPGDNSLVYGALLTPKGAVVVDYWVIRQADALTLIAPRSGHQASLDLFRRQLPPRLAKVVRKASWRRAISCRLCCRAVKLSEPVRRRAANTL